MSRQEIMLVTTCTSSIQLSCTAWNSVCWNSWCLAVVFALLTGAVKVISAKFSRCGSPLVVLASRHAFLYDMSMRCWLRIADDCFPASNFASSFSYPQGGELGKLQIDIGKFMARKPIWSRSACTFDCFSVMTTWNISEFCSQPTDMGISVSGLQMMVCRHAPIWRPSWQLL